MEAKTKTRTTLRKPPTSRQNAHLTQEYFSEGQSMILVVKQSPLGVIWGCLWLSQLEVLLE